AQSLRSAWPSSRPAQRRRAFRCSSAPARSATVLAGCSAVSGKRRQARCLRLATPPNAATTTLRREPSGQFLTLGTRVRRPVLSKKHIMRASHAHIFNSFFSSLRKLQSVPSARSSRGALEHPELVEAQGVEARLS